MLSLIAVREDAVMAVITVRNIPESVHRALKLRAAKNGRSTEAEVRHILEQAIARKGRDGFATRLRAFAEEAGLVIELDIPTEPEELEAANFD
jgi:plasmid stability protein